MSVRNIYKGWKSTILGVFLFGSGLNYVYFSTSPDYIVMSIQLSSGIGLIFMPDYFINRLKTFIGRRSRAQQ